MTHETRQLADFARGLAFEVIPQHVRGTALDVLVDQIGCQIGCSALPWAKQVREVHRAISGTPEATVVRYGDRLPLAATAFTNSTFGHSFEYDDTNPFFKGHPGAELLPALIALAEREHVSGRDFLTAFIAAYEVRGHIGWAVSPDLIEHGGPHPVTACGVFGAAAGVAKLLGLDAEHIEHALNIAGSYSGGLMQVTQTGGSVKRIYAAIAASSGIHSALLAQAGITGPEAVLEGNRGLLRVYSSAYRPERLTADLGRNWTIEHAKFKLYSCCAAIHPAIDGLRKLLGAHQISTDNITSVDVSYPSGFHASAGVESPRDLLAMQFSTSYSLALTALRGRNTPREYSQEALVDPHVRQFASKVRVLEEAELGKRHEDGFAVRVRVKTSAGSNFEELVVTGKANVSSLQIDEKFRAQVRGSLSDEATEKLLSVLRGIATLDDMAKLSAMLVFEDR